MSLTELFVNISSMIFNSGKPLVYIYIYIHTRDFNLKIKDK